MLAKILQLETHRTLLQRLLRFGLLAIASLLPIHGAEAADVLSPPGSVQGAGNFVVAPDVDGRYVAVYVMHDPSNELSAAFFRYHDGNDWETPKPIGSAFRLNATSLQARSDSNGNVAVAWGGVPRQSTLSGTFAAVISEDNLLPQGGVDTAVPTSGPISDLDMDIGRDGRVVVASTSATRVHTNAEIRVVNYGGGEIDYGPAHNLGEFPRAHLPQVEVAVRADGTVVAAWQSQAGVIQSQAFRVEDADGTLSPLGEALEVAETMSGAGEIQLATTYANDHSLIYVDDGASLFGNIHRNEDWRSRERLEYRSSPIRNPHLGYAASGPSLAVYEQDYGSYGSKIFAVDHSRWSWRIGQRIGLRDPIQTQPHVDVADDGSAVVVWREQDFAEDREARIVAARLNADGHWESLMTVVSGEFEAPRVAIHSVSDFMVTWFDSDAGVVKAYHVFD